MRVRQAVGALALVVILILAAFGIHSCQVSQQNSALMSYANNVTSLIQESAGTSSKVFGVLQNARSSSNSSGGSSVQTQLDEAVIAPNGAQDQLSRARSLDVPGEVSGAQQHLLLVLQMRVDGIGNIAAHIQRALAGAQDAISAIASEMARLYASDAVYKDYTAPEIASALHKAGIGVGGTNGVQIAQQQFVPDLRWLQPSFVATALRTRFGPSGGKVAAGTHGHALNSVSVAGTTLQTGSTNTIPATPPATFALNFTNTGQNAETNVVCKVSAVSSSGTTVTGQQTIPQTGAGQTYTCQVPLRSTPPTGSAQVTATVGAVPGEKNAANNTLMFPVSFQ
ncbi:MAG: hypothetical protein M3076_10735 [Actinomycetota bacterium]|nr:hypothetical protein [Actinomycetota bacterium]